MLKHFTRCFCTLIITLAYMPLSLDAQHKDSMNLYTYSLDELMNLRIESAARRTESIADIPASIVIISRQEIEQQGWQNIEEVLCNIPGMYQINDYLWFGADNFGVRGFFSSGSFNSMVIMVNGVSQKEDWYNSFPLSKINVPVEAIDRVEIIRGPMSVVYGNNAFLGAINIVTNQNSNSSIASIGIGTNMNYKVFGRVAGEKEKLKYSINLSAFGSNGINEPYSKMASKIENDWGLPDNPTSNGQLTDHRKFIDAWFSYDKFYFGFLQSHTHKGVIDYYPGYDDGHIAHIQSSNSIFGYKNSFGEQVDIKAQIGYYSFRNLLDYKHNSDTTAYGFNDIFCDAMDAEFNINLKPSNKWNINLGAYYRQVFRDKLVVDAPNLSDDYVNLDAGLSRKDRKHTWATFFQTSYSVTPQIILLAGARIEQTPSYKINYAVRFDPTESYTYLFREGTYKYGQPFFIPRAAILYHINDNHHLKLMYGRAIKQASMGENMDVVRYPDREQLKPANMKTIEFNYYGLLTPNAITNISIFQNYANNLISRTNQMEDGVMRLFNTNSGELSTIGFEASTQYKPTNRISSTVSIVVQKSKNLQKGYENIALEYAPNFLAYATLSYQIFRNFSVGLSGHFVGAMETYWRPDTRDPLDPNDNRNPIQLIADGSRIGNRTPGYFIVNTNLRINNLFGKKFYAAVHIHNILNNEIRYPTTRSNDIFDKGTLGYGRYITLNFGMMFNE